jgi:glycosyltransferase involved in cell wall biosynthesis
VDPTDPSAVAAAVNRLLGDPELARRLGAAGRSRAETFAWPLVASRVRALIDELAGGPRRFSRP